MHSVSASVTAATEPAREPARGRRTILYVLSSWFVAATALGASGLLLRVPPFVFPLLVWGTFFSWLAIYRRSASVRAALSGVGLWLPIAFHALVRTGYGLGICVEGARGNMPESFANVAGPGDVVVGVLAVLALVFAARTDRLARFVLLGWNALALLDIVIAFVLAQRVLVFGQGPSAFPAMQRFPYAWLPLFVLPLIFATHVWIFARLRKVQ